jgi:hypothetical protein
MSELESEFDKSVKRLAETPKGYCIYCINFIKDHEDDKQCHCKYHKKYMTQNAHRKLACKGYVEIQVGCKSCDFRGKCLKNYKAVYGCWAFGRNWQEEMKKLKLS